MLQMYLDFSKTFDKVPYDISVVELVAYALLQLVGFVAGQLASDKECSPTDIYNPGNRINKWECRRDSSWVYYHSSFYNDLGKWVD